MVNIRKRGSKWQVQIRRAGHSSITKTFNRREEAIAWGRNQEVRLDAAEAGIAQPVKETLAKLLGRNVAEITPQKKSAASESRRISRLLKDPTSQHRICDLTPEILSKFRDRRLLDGLRAAANDLQIIRHVLNVASSEWGMNIKKNPLHNVRFSGPSEPHDRRLKAGELKFCWQLQTSLEVLICLL